MGRLELFPFEFFDVLRRRWVRARYRAELAVLVDRYAAIRILGEPEIREPGDPGELTAGHVQRGPG